MTSYKLEHENFVSGHDGTTYLEVALLSSIPCVGYFARNVLAISNFNRVIKPGLLLDFELLVLPCILSVTVLSNYIGLFIFAILATSLLLYLHILKKSGQLSSFGAVMDDVNLSERKVFITNFRSVLYMFTAVAILAVDFPACPRRLAKTETFGFGGMDVGVGLFVVANAVVSREARKKYNILPALYQVKKAVVSSLPLLVLGFARFLAVKGADYHEHVTEYGVHWNFFFTLAALKVTLSLVYCILPVKYSLAGAIAVLAGHQTLLSGGLSDYIVNGLDGAGGRSMGYFDANREGIHSLPGYIAIYMFGVDLGASFFQPRHKLKEWMTVARNLAAKFVAFTVVMATFHNTVQPVSRRFANAAFIFWMMSLTCLMILECLLIDIVITCTKSREQAVKDKGNQDHIKDVHKTLSEGEDIHKTLSEGNQKQIHRNSTLTSSINRDMKSHDCVQNYTKYDHSLDSCVCLLDAISFNSLLFFLLANLMTGAVNMSFSTIHANDFSAVVILITYMFSLSVIVVCLYRRNICTKFW